MTDRVIHRVALDDLHLENQHFNARDDIKPWLQNTLHQNKGIDVVIERSDSSKIIFRCKNNINEKKLVRSKSKDIKVPVRKHTTCPFKIRANYSVKNKVWSLLLINEEHDHPIDNVSSMVIQPPNINNIVKNSKSVNKISEKTPSSSTTGPIELAIRDSVESSGSFDNSNNNRENPKSRSPLNRKSNSRSSKSSTSSSTKSSQRNSAASLVSQNSSAATSVDDLKDIHGHDQQGPPLPTSLASSSSFQGLNIHTSSDPRPLAPSKRRKSVPNPLPKVRKLQDNFTTISPIQEDLNVNTGFVVPAIELHQLQSMHRILPQPRSQQELQQLLQIEQASQESNRAPQSRGSRQRNVNQSHLTSNQLTLQQQQHQLDNDILLLLQQPQHIRRHSHHQHQMHQHSDGHIQLNQEHRQQMRTSEQFSIVHILQNLQNYVHEKVKEEILDNKNLHENMKTDMMDSFVSQIILDYKHILSSQFLYSLRQNVYDKRTVSDPISEIVQSDGDQQPQAPQFTPLRKVNAAQNWMPSSTAGVSGLIRLSPLLNDNDTTEYVVGPAATNQNSNAGQNTSLDNLTHLPGISSSTLNYLMQLPPPSSNSLIFTTTSGNSTNQQFNQNQPPPLMPPPLQNPGQQLPPLNSIQKLPPQGNVNNSNQNSLPPPLNNITSTLNPSSLLKNTKSNKNSGNNASGGTGGSLNNTSNNSVFNNYFVNPSGTNSAFMFNNNPSTNPSNTNSSKDGNNANNTTNNLLNNMSNYDPGW